MISWPNSGGKDSTKSTAMGMSQPAGMFRIFSAIGVSFWRFVSALGSWMHPRVEQTYRDDLVLVDGDEDDEDDDGDADEPYCCSEHAS